MGLVHHWLLDPQRCTLSFRWCSIGFVRTPEGRYWWSSVLDLGTNHYGYGEDDECSYRYVGRLHRNSNSLTMSSW